MIKSAGILLYKKEKGKYYILLTHFGGPYWEKIDKGAWSLQKGIQDPNEKIIDTAKRESFEETNLVAYNEIKYLTSKKAANNKLIIMFTSYFDKDISSFKCNTFEMEYPKGSGKIENYPEMDKIRWFTLEEAKEYAHKNYLYFINKFEEKIINRNN